MRVNLTYDLSESRKIYRALFTPVAGVKKYNIGIITHYGIQFFTEPRTALVGSVANTDVW